MNKKQQMQKRTENWMCSIQCATVQCTVHHVHRAHEQWCSAGKNKYNRSSNTGYTIILRI